MVAKSLDPVATRTSILESATKLFSAKGLAATTTAEIASEAGVTKSLVLYHFSTKEDLWRAVLAEKTRPFFEATSHFLSDDAPADVRQIAKLKFERLRSDQELARLMAWMSLEEILIAPELGERIQANRRKILSEPRKAGIPEGVEPHIYIACMMSAIDGYFRFRKMYSALIGKSLVTREAEDEFYDAFSSIFFAHLEKFEEGS